MIRVNYDRDADAASIKLVNEIEPGRVQRSVPCDDDIINGAVILDFDAAERLVSIEVLGASRVLPPELLQGD